MMFTGYASAFDVRVTRLDAEFYNPVHVENARKVDALQGDALANLCSRLIDHSFLSVRTGDYQAAALEVSAKHSDENLYEDATLVTRLCQAAYAYLQEFGIKYVLIALDELETAAEAATYGLEVEEMKYLDGRAIKLIGKAIKEEDPRGKLPWLRYVALCSPAIGNELREIRSTARRFELVELSQNAFADVSSFVQLLKDDGRLSENYPAGLVEAAYAMSGGNFGWFNVAMANIDGVISGRRAKREPTDGTVGSLFDEAIRVSSRMRDYVLDHRAIEELNVPREFRESARELLYGELPVPLSQWTGEQCAALLGGTNEYGEPLAIRYHRVEWSDQDISRALRAGKFTRGDGDEWTLSGVDQPLDILEGAIKTSAPSGSTQQLQSTAPGTLGHLLQELKVGQATEKLGQLANEVGIRLDSDTETSLAEITGSIVESFHDLVKDFERERERLDDLNSRLKLLKSELDDAPNDFTYPPSQPALGELLARPALIDSALSETLAEDVESLISEHEASSRLGNFHPLMTAAKSLLAEPKNALGRLAGQVATVENAATGYRQSLLESRKLVTRQVDSMPLRYWRNRARTSEASSRSDHDPAGTQSSPRQQHSRELAHRPSHQVSPTISVLFAGYRELLVTRAADT